MSIRQNVLSGVLGSDMRIATPAAEWLNGNISMCPRPCLYSSEVLNQYRVGRKYALDTMDTMGYL